MTRYLSLLVIPLAWLASIYASSPIFGQLRSDTLHEWLSYHTLISMRAFEQWGFWKLMGVSILNSKTYEWQDFDITNLTRDDGLYTAYPSLGLDIPYAVFKLFNLDVSIANLQIYSLIFNRLLLSLILFLIYKELTQFILSHIKLYSSDGQKQSFQISEAASLIGIVVWLLTPAVLYFTQNIYFVDQAVLLPVYSIFLIALKLRYKLHEANTRQRLLLFLLAFISTGYDWYSWTFLLFLLLIYFYENSSLNFKQRLSASSPILRGWALAILIYCSQLVYFKNGVFQLLQRALHRLFTNNMSDHTFSQINGFWEVLASYLNEYVPTSGWVLFVVLILVVYISVLRLAKSSGNFDIESKAVLRISFDLGFLVPLLHNLLLGHHTYTHNFSFLKLSPFFVFVFTIIPTMALLIDLRQKYKYYFLYALIVSLLFFGIFTAPKKIIDYTQYYISTTFAESLGKIVKEEVGYKQVPFSLTLPINYFPPHPLWYSGRRVYSIARFYHYVHLLKLDQKEVEYYYIDRKGVKPARRIAAGICDRNVPVRERVWRVKMYGLGGDFFDQKLIICKIDTAAPLLQQYGHGFIFTDP
ncbi:MAG: hypothetical protein ACK4QL_09010 [Pseudanabaenaceae cyanobacterium]